jgi:predicted SnoaL-like aldol condensation-catalyzing enzyme
VIHSHYSNPDGSGIVAVGIMRLKDGVLVEHRDATEPEARKEESNSKLPIFGDGFPR